MIDCYQFGEIVIKGKKYASDVIICPSGVSSWWRKEGHQLHIEDLAKVIKEKPEVLVVGTGKYGIVAVLPETQQWLEEHGVELIAQDTDQACRTYNQLCSSRKVMAALHLTC